MSTIIKKPAREIGAILANISVAFAVLTALFIVASVLHEYFYFMMIDHGMLQIYQATDYLKLSIQWLPPTLAAMALGLFINYTDLSARFEAVEKFGHAGLQPWSGPDKWMQKLSYTLLIICDLGLPFATWRTINILQIPCFMIMAFIVSRQIIKGNIPLSEKPHDSLMLYLFIIVLLVGAPFSGVVHAAQDIKLQVPSHYLVGLSQKKDIILLRAIDKGIMYKIPQDNRVYYLNWSQIIEIQSHTIEINDEPLYKTMLRVFGRS